MKVHQGTISGKGLRFGIVVSRFNELLTRRLLEGAIDTLLRHEANEADIEVVWVPGAFELPLAAAKLVRTNRCDAVICLGLIMRGATAHADLIAGQASRGISTLGMQSDIPVVFGVVSAETMEQGIERAGTKQGNRGRDAAMTAMELVSVYRSVEMLNDRGHDRQDAHEGTS